jgi:hypothetical protein
MTQPFPIRFFLPALLIVTGCMISVAAEAKCDQCDCPSPPPCPLPPLQSLAAGSEASISINRGKIQVYCAKGDSTRECADALSDVIISEGGGSTTVVYATTSIKCSDAIYEVSTGNNQGSCETTAPEGKPADHAHCYDNKNNEVSGASCQSGCGNTDKGGSCKITPIKP